MLSSSSSSLFTATVILSLQTFVVVAVVVHYHSHPVFADICCCRRRCSLPQSSCLCRHLLLSPSLFTATVILSLQTFVVVAVVVHRHIHPIFADSCCRRRRCSPPQSSCICRHLLLSPSLFTNIAILSLQTFVVVAVVIHRHSHPAVVVADMCCCHRRCSLPQSCCRCRCRPAAGRAAGQVSPGPQPAVGG